MCAGVRACERGNGFVFFPLGLRLANGWRGEKAIFLTPHPPPTEKEARSLLRPFNMVEVY